MNLTLPRSRTGWAGLLAAAVYSLGVELFFGFGLAFAPGWANGWSTGLSFPLVLATGLSCVVFALVLTAFVLTGAAYAVCRPPTGRRPVTIGLVTAVVVAGVVSAVAFKAIHARAKADWPNGYPNPQVGP